jgi:hypothetical protein
VSFLFACRLCIKSPRDVDLIPHLSKTISCDFLPAWHASICAVLRPLACDVYGKTIRFETAWRSLDGALELHARRKNKVVLVAAIRDGLLKLYTQNTVQ